MADRHAVTGTQADGESDRQGHTDRLTYKQMGARRTDQRRDTRTFIQPDGHADRQIGRGRQRQRLEDGQTDGVTARKTGRAKPRHADTQTDRQASSVPARPANRDSVRDTDRQIERQSQAETNRETYK